MCAGHACTAVALRAAVASNHKTEQSICACDSLFRILVAPTFSLEREMDWGSAREL